MEAKTAARFNLSGVGQSIVNGGRNLGRRAFDAVTTRPSPVAPPPATSGLDEAAAGIFNRHYRPPTPPSRGVIGDALDTARSVGTRLLDTTQNVLDPIGGLLDKARSSDNRFLRFIGGGTLNSATKKPTWGSSLARQVLNLPSDMSGASTAGYTLDLLRGRRGLTPLMGAVGKGTLGTALAGGTLQDVGEGAQSAAFGPLYRGYWDEPLSYLSKPFENAAHLAQNGPTNLLSAGRVVRDAVNEADWDRIRGLIRPVQDANLPVASGVVHAVAGNPEGRPAGLPLRGGNGRRTPSENTQENAARLSSLYQSGLNSSQAVDLMRRVQSPDAAVQQAAMNELFNLPVVARETLLNQFGSQMPESAVARMRGINDLEMQHGVGPATLSSLRAAVHSSDPAARDAAVQAFQRLPDNARTALLKQFGNELPPEVARYLNDLPSSTPANTQPMVGLHPNTMVGPRDTRNTEPMVGPFPNNQEPMVGPFPGESPSGGSSSTPAPGMDVKQQQLARLPSQQLFQRFAGTNPQVQSNPSMLSSMWSWFQSQPREVQIALAAGVGLSLAGLVGSMAGGNSGFGNWAPLMGLAGMGALGYGAYQSGLLGGRSAPTPAAPRGADPAQIMNGLTALAQRAPDHFAPPGSFLRDMWNRTTSRSPANRSQ